MPTLPGTPSIDAVFLELKIWCGQNAKDSADFLKLSLTTRSSTVWTRLQPFTATSRTFSKLSACSLESICNGREHCQSGRPANLQVQVQLWQVSRPTCTSTYRRILYTFSESYIHFPNLIYIFRIIYTFSKSYIHFPNPIYIFRILYTFSKSYIHFPNPIYIF